MARSNENGATARVLDIDVFYYLDKGIMRYAKECRDDFFYPNKVISGVNDSLNDAKYTLEAELSKAHERCTEAYSELEAARSDIEYDDDGDPYTPDYSAEERAYAAAVYDVEVVERKIAELKELRKHYYEIEAEYKDYQNAFESFLDKDLEDASQWMKEEYKLMKDYIWVGQQLSL